MKEKTFFTNILLGVCLFLATTSCSDKKKNNEATTQQRPLNISIYLDLSDRLVRDMQPSQVSRDTAAVGYILDYFKKQTMGPRILQSQNRLKVFFYPAPHSSDIATLAGELDINMAQLKGVDKRKKLESMKGLFQKNLSQIYNKTISEHEWIGCDIWDFFSSKKVDAQCIKKGARNILIILTDGYLYDANNKIKEGNAYSYILPQTLRKDASLIVRRKGLDNLDVGVFEVNPYSKQEGYKLIPTLENWLKKMGISAGHLVVAETDLPANTQTLLKSFLEKENEKQL